MHRGAYAMNSNSTEDTVWLWCFSQQGKPAVSPAVWLDPTTQYVDVLTVSEWTDDA